MALDQSRKGDGEEESVSDEIRDRYFGTAFMALTMIGYPVWGALALWVGLYYAGYATLPWRVLHIVAAADVYWATWLLCGLIWHPEKPR